jgi:formyltetrahydrofolate-dependent phosphoribosylglycinamide formyltransferase
MNIAVFASGRGSNFQAILNAINEGRLPAHVTLLVSNNSSAGALDLARSKNIPAIHLSQKQCSSEESYVEQLSDLLTRHNVELIALAGYMKRIPTKIVQRFRNRILNIHPALLPAFGGPGMYGSHVHEAVIASGMKVSGATVHIVDEEYDRGPIVMQKTVEVASNDTPETLAAKVLPIEHEIYPKVLAAFAGNRVRIQGKRAWIQEQA